MFLYCAPTLKTEGVSMAGNKVDFDSAAEHAKSKSSGQKNERSSIVFPYHDLDTAVEVAKAVYEAGGLGGCDLAELAAEMGQTISGAFRLKTSTAKIFDLADKDGRSAIKLTALGQKIVNNATEAEARVDAFLSVPLYIAIYEKYKGQNLPPAKALEREMQALGVSSKQGGKARIAFERSARQAGFFDKMEGRLVKPRTGISPPQDQANDANPVDEKPVDRGGNGGSGGGGGGKYHPFIQGLLQSLPEPNTVWSVEGRAAWLEAAANNFKLMYQGEGNIIVKAEQTKNEAVE